MNILQNLLTPCLVNPLQNFAHPVIGGGLSKICRAIRLNGANNYIQLARRAIDPDGDNVLEFWTPTSLVATQNIVSQNNSNTGSQREFHLFVNAGNLVVNFGGVETTIVTTAQGLLPNSSYTLSIIGNTASVTGSNGQLLATTSIVRGAAREPSAPTRIGVRGAAGTAAGVTLYFQGLIPYIRINNFYYAMDAVSQAIQLPTPSGLGAELFDYGTSSIFGPVTKLGGDSYQLATSGSSAVIEQNPTPLMVSTRYLVEFEIFNYVSGSVSFNGTTFQSLGVSRNGFYRRIVDTGGSTARLQLVNGGTPANFIIKNISFKPLGTSNPATIFNSVPEQWEKINCNIRPQVDSFTFVDTFWLFGASIINNVTGLTPDTIPLMTTEFNRRYNKDVTLVDKGFSGQDLKQLSATWESIKSEITGQSNVAVYLDVLGNTVSANRPYSSLTAAKKLEIKTDYENLINSIRNNGNIPIALDLSFRNYGGNTFSDESLGSKPFNDEIVYPVTNALCQESVLNGEPITQWYNIILNCFNVGLGDQVHPNQAGYWLLRNYLIDAIATLKKYRGLNIPQKRGDISGSMGYNPLSFVLSFGGTGSSQIDSGVYGLQRVGQEVADFSICNPVGYDWNPITISTSFPAMRSNVGIPITDQTYSLNASSLKVSGGSISSTTFVDVVTLKGFNPNQDLTLRLAAYRTSSSTDYIGEYVANGSSPIQINARFTVGNEEATNNIGEIVTQADSNGHVVISCRAVTNIAYLMGLEVVL